MEIKMGGGNGGVVRWWRGAKPVLAVRKNVLIARAWMDVRTNLSLDGRGVEPTEVSTSREQGTPATALATTNGLNDETRFCTEQRDRERD